MARGRKRKTGRRLANGRLAEPTTQAARKERRDMTKVAVEARQRVFGLPKEQSRLPDAGDALGRFALAGVPGGVSRAQRDAGRLYEAIVRDYQRHLGARRLMSGSELERVGGHDNSTGDSPQEIERYERAKGRYVRARRALLLSQEPTAQMVVDAVVLDDVEMWQNVGVLRIALNAIAHEFRDELGKGAQAA